MSERANSQHRHTIDKTDWFISALFVAGMYVLNRVGVIPTLAYSGLIVLALAAPLMRLFGFERVSMAGVELAMAKAEKATRVAQGAVDALVDYVVRRTVDRSVMSGDLTPAEVLALRDRFTLALAEVGKAPEEVRLRVTAPLTFEALRDTVVDLVDDMGREGGGTSVDVPCRVTDRVPHPDTVEAAAAVGGVREEFEDRLQQYRETYEREIKNVDPSRR